MSNKKMISNMMMKRKKEIRCLKMKLRVNPNKKTMTKMCQLKLDKIKKMLDTNK